MSSSGTARKSWKKSYGQFVSTGQISRWLSCSPKTICRWIDAGKLQGIRLPGPGREERRVHRDAFRAFLIANKFKEALVAFAKWEQDHPWPGEHGNENG